MAYDLDQGEPEEPTGLYADPRAQEEAPHSRPLLRIAGALAVMGVFAGGLWFAYTTGLRHGGGSADRGEIPLVRADTTPFKVKPENPGGMQIPDRDMLIYGQQHPEVEHLLPPPEQPMARPMPPPPPPLQQPVSHTTPPSSPGPPSDQAISRPVPLPLPGASPKQATVQPALVPSPSGLQASQPEAQSAGVAQPAAAPQQAASEAASPAPARQPQPAPDLIGQKIEELEAAATANRAKRTESGRAGGLRLQLGALRSESEARATWERLKRSNTDLLGNLTGTAVRADLGDKGIYYRIETGSIGDAATAARVCSELRQRHLACIIIR